MKVETARMFDPALSENDLMDPEVNMYYAGRYLKWQLNRYGGDINKAISAYNAGRAIESNVYYVSKVLRRRQQYGRR